MNQSKFVAILCNLLKAREKLRAQVAIDFGFPFHWLTNWREIFKPITKRSNCNCVITFDSHLKTALINRDDPTVTVSQVEKGHSVVPHLMESAAMIFFVLALRAFCLNVSEYYDRLFARV